jgi:flagellar motor switch protein FliG
LMLAVGQTVRESLDIEKLGLTMKTASSAIITMFLEGIIARKKGMIGTELKTTKKISTNS